MSNSQQQQQGLQMTVAQAVELAAKHQAKGNLQQAENILQQVLQNHPKFPPALHLLGVIAHQVGKTDLALQMIKDAIAGEPGNGLFYSNFAEMSRLKGDVQTAIEYGEKAVELAPGSATAHSNLGIAYYDNKDTDKAEACQLKALEINPKLAPALNNLGSIYRERKEKEKAIEQYKKVLAVNPGYLEAKSNLGAVLTETEQFDEAIKVLIETIKQNPRYAEAHCNIGSAFLATEENQKALAAFQNALKHKAEYPEAFLGLAKVLQEENKPEEAEKAVLRAIAIDPKNVDALSIYGGILIDLGFTEKAEQILNQALEIKPDSIAALNVLATLQMEMGALDESEATFTMAAQIDPENALNSHIALTQVKKTKSEDDEHLQAMVEAAKEIDTMTGRKAMSLNFSLGKCYDDLKDADKAFPYFKAACDYKRTTFQHSSDDHTLYIENLKKTFNKEFFDKFRGSGCDSDVPIFVLGMPRSGTTLTEQIIASHPEVYGAGELPDMLNLCKRQKPGEQDMFPNTMKNFTAADFKKFGEDYVAGLKERSPSAAHITDKMPANFQFVGMIHLALPNAKIVHIKRNPVDTCLSCYTKNFKRGQYFSYDLAELGRYYQDYVAIMDHWREVLPEGSFYEVQYEELVGDNENQARQLIDFCGLEWNDACLESHKTERSIKTASVTQVRQPIYKSSVQRWKPYEKHLQPLLDVLGDLVPQD